MTTKSIHSVLPVMAMIIGLPAIAGLGWYWWSLTRPYEVPQGRSVFDVAQGVWKEAANDSSCREVHHSISFSPDHRLMYYTANKKIEAATGKNDSIFTYDILSATTSSIRGAMRGETRRTPRGVLVVWDFVLRSPDRYSWHEADWAPGLYTNASRRCSAEELK